MARRFREGEKIWPSISLRVSRRRASVSGIANNTTELDSYADNENFLNEDTYLLIIATSRTVGRA